MYIDSRANRANKVTGHRLINLIIDKSLEDVRSVDRCGGASATSSARHGKDMISVGMKLKEVVKGSEDETCSM